VAITRLPKGVFSKTKPFYVQIKTFQGEKTQLVSHGLEWFGEHERSPKRGLSQGERSRTQRPAQGEASNTEACHWERSLTRGLSQGERSPTRGLSQGEAPSQLRLHSESPVQTTSHQT